MKILLLDIETAPHKVYAWGLWDQNIATNQIVEPGFTMCWAAKWYGKRGVMFDSIMESNPSQMIRRVHGLLDEADVVVTYNGIKFDVKRLNSEFLLEGLDPPSNYRQLDLLKVTRATFGFPSNKLDYVSQQLKVGAKTKHMGMEMWRDCMDKKPRAWAVMKRYNIQDVRLLEKLYKRLLPWIKNHPNWGPFVDSKRPTCRACKSHRVVEKGFEHTNTGTYKRYKCMNCGKPLKGRKMVKPPAEGILV